MSWLCAWWEGLGHSVIAVRTDGILGPHGDGYIDDDDLLFRVGKAIRIDAGTDEQKEVDGEQSTIEAE